MWDSVFGVFVSSFVSVHSFICHCHLSCLFVCTFVILFLYLTHFHVTGHIVSSSGLYIGTVMWCFVGYRGFHGGHLYLQTMPLLALVFNHGKNCAWWWSRFKEPPGVASYGHRHLFPYMSPSIRDAEGRFIPLFTMSDQVRT